MRNKVKIFKLRLSAFLILLLLTLNCNNSPTNTEISDNKISGFVFDGSKPVGENLPISKAVIKYNEFSTTSNDSGYFSLDYVGPSDPILQITAANYHEYLEKLSRMVSSAFYLIPTGEIYQDFAILTWNYADNNPHNWHRKWDRQTEFFIVKNGASDKQVQDLVSILRKDEYYKMTGGLYHSNININILDADPNWNSNQKKGKTKIYFADGIIQGGIGHSEDGGDGIIDYAEIGWNRNQQIDENVVWHELSHTVTAGGHINHRKSVNSETMGGGKVFAQDEKVFNCIYNSPPKRTN